MPYTGIEKAQKYKLQSLHREFERYEMSSSESIEHIFHVLGFCPQDKGVRRRHSQQQSGGRNFTHHANEI